MMNPPEVAATSTAPSTSSRAPEPSVGRPRYISGSSASPAIGSAITARQPSTASTVPPVSGPRQLSAAAMPATRPSASVRVRPSNRRVIAAIPSVGTAAAPAPWRIRATMRTPNDGASAPAAAPTVISTTPNVIGPRIPARSETRP